MASTILRKSFQISSAILVISLWGGNSRLCAETIPELSGDKVVNESDKLPLVKRVANIPVSAIAMGNQTSETPAVSQTEVNIGNQTIETPIVSQTEVNIGNQTINIPEIAQVERSPAQSSVTTDNTSDIPNNSIWEQIQNYSGEAGISLPEEKDYTGTNTLDQVTNVGQLRDVSPGDWAYEALRNLVERYGCIAGYPDGTYRGNRAMTRYEFAAGLNACLNQLERIIGTGTTPPDNRDLVSIRRLVEEFQSELQSLGARVDNLEGRVSMLEDEQFSATTKLEGDILWALVHAWGDQKAVPSGQTPTQDLVYNPMFADQIRLNLDTSFTGKDLLRTRLQARNVTNVSGRFTGTTMTRLSFDGVDDTANDVLVSQLFYRFPIGEKILVQIDATNAELFEGIIDTINPDFTENETGSISRFGRFSPIYRTYFSYSGNTAATINYKFNDSLTLSAAYLSGSSPNPSGSGFLKGGIFNGSYTALTQLTFKPSDAIALGLTYSHSYYAGGNVFLNGAIGSAFANQPFPDTNFPQLAGSAATSADYFGLEAHAKLGFVSVGGWVGFQNAEAKSGFQKGADADIWNWAVNLAFPDLGGEGNLLGFVFGMPPKVTNNDFIQNGRNREDDDTTFHIEALYRYQLTDNIAITPGLLVLLNPEHNDNNDTVWVGTIRTTFSF